MSSDEISDDVWGNGLKQDFGSRTKWLQHASCANQTVGFVNRPEDFPCQQVLTAGADAYDLHLWGAGKTEAFAENFHYLCFAVSFLLLWTADDYQLCIRLPGCAELGLESAGISAVLGDEPLCIHFSQHSFIHLFRKRSLHGDDMGWFQSRRFTRCQRALYRQDPGINPFGKVWYISEFLKFFAAGG